MIGFIRRLLAGSAGPGDDARQRMIAEQLVARGIRDERVLRAIGSIDRAVFADSGDSYGDHPLPIGCGQTISQPYIVALMSELLSVRNGDRVLEIGTGSGYQAAVLAALGARVTTIERHRILAARARSALSMAGYGKVDVREGNGAEGWPDDAPYDRIIITAACEAIPPALLSQAAPDAIVVAPLGPVTANSEKLEQRLERWSRTAGGPWQREDCCAVRFVPFVDRPAEKR